MPQICIQKLPDDAAPPTNVPGVRHTIHIEPPAPQIKTWKDLLNWRRKNTNVPVTIRRTITAVSPRPHGPENDP